MAETLLAILLVNSSAKGSTLVYRWPPDPVSSPRLRRALPNSLPTTASTDNPWRASHYPNDHSFTRSVDVDASYKWERPNALLRDRSVSFGHSISPPSGRNTPSKDEFDDAGLEEDYDHVFGYSSEFLAGILCPHNSMCHQKFQLIVDDLVFIGHPVCADIDGAWRFKPEKLKHGSRGRDSRNRHASGSTSPSRSPSLEANTPTCQCAWLHTFHFVMVLDLPDPSSSASGNVSKYFDVIYEQIAFTIAAVLFQEQVLSNFVEEECDLLGSLKDDCIRKGVPYSKFSEQALQKSSVAPAMKTLYEAIKSSSMAYVSIHDLPLELQLPPYLDVLLHSEEDNEQDLLNADVDDEQAQLWGPEMSFGWRLPSLAPWKSLLLLDDDDGQDPFANLRSSYVTPDDRSLVESLLRFLDTASVFLSLADMASLLDWDLEAQVFPTVRWLVQHRKAKVVDVVHSGLKTVFTLPPTFAFPLSQLIADFAKKFTHPAIPPLPQILSIISTSSAKQSGNHFFASVVQSKELIQMYHDVVLWMLKRDMLITLHLRIRIVATSELKRSVRVARENSKAAKALEPSARGRKTATRRDTDTDTEQQQEFSVTWLSLSPRSARRYSQQRVPSNESSNSKLSELIIQENDSDGRDAENENGTREDADASDPSDGKEESGAEAEDELLPSMINDPGRATPQQRRWLSAMSIGKDVYIARRFDLINQYFDGRTTDDEILYRAEISRKQLREVLHHYEEYLQTFLLPA